jgi:hypothetical protein
LQALQGIVTVNPGRQDEDPRWTHQEKHRSGMNRLRCEILVAKGGIEPPTRGFSMLNTIVLKRPGKFLKL